MTTVDKDVLKKSAAALIDKAAEASTLAKAQRRTADDQHETAHKLEELSDELKKEAAVLKKNLKDLPE